MCARRRCAVIVHMTGGFGLGPFRSDGFSVSLSRTWNKVLSFSFRVLRRLGISAIPERMPHGFFLVPVPVTFRVRVDADPERKLCRVALTKPERIRVLFGLSRRSG